MNEMEVLNLTENGVAEPIGNLTYKQGLLSGHSGRDALPGYLVVVFEKLKGGGARFVKLINSGERFQKFNFAFWESPQKYFAIAVNQSILRYSFDETVILDDDLRQFDLTYHLTYRAADARTLAELAGQDPLKRLRVEIARAIGRSCAQRKWEMIKTRFRELELIVLNGERTRLRQVGTTLGIEILSIEIDRRLPAAEKDVDLARLQAAADKEKFRIEHDVSQMKEKTTRDWSHPLNKDEVDQKYELKEQDLGKEIDLQGKRNRVHRADTHQQLLDRRDQAIGTAFEVVAQDIDTPAALVEGTEALRSISGMQGEQPTTSALPGTIGRTKDVRLLPGQQEAELDPVTNLLNQAMTEIEQSQSTSAQKRSLRSKILSLVADALLDDEVDEAALQNYAEKLAELRDQLRTTPRIPAVGEEMGTRAIEVPQTLEAERSTSFGQDKEQALDSVFCTVFAPPKAAPGQNLMVQVFAHLAQQDEFVRKLAEEFDERAKRLTAKRLDQTVSHGSPLTFCLSIPGLEIDEPIQKLIWRCEPESVQFGVRVPEDFRPAEIIGTIYVTQDSIPFGHVKFLLRIEVPNEPLPKENDAPAIESTWKRYQYAFISYASADRREVLKRVQMLSRLRVDFFQDLMTLEPGDHWAEKIYESIDKSDVFFLFWSSAARASKWVMDEVRYALARKGSDKLAAPEIVPIIIEGPPPVPPPPELSDIHFNDAFIYFIAGSPS